MMPEIPLTVVGHLGAWEARMRVDALGTLWVAWLRHAAHGLLGIYVLPKPTPLPATLPEQSWVSIQGLLRPRQVTARTDVDPRSEWDGRHTPLLIHATSITAGARAASPTLEVRQIQVKPGRWIGIGYLAPTQHLADVAALTLIGPANRAVLSWNRPYGVTTWVAGRRYLRYVLIEDTRSHEQGI
jgi:hypothetical protein